jgi:hypothetical protein
MYDNIQPVSYLKELISGRTSRSPGFRKDVERNNSVGQVSSRSIAWQFAAG